jgi:hypothetical protein
MRCLRVLVRADETIERGEGGAEAAVAGSAEDIAEKDPDAPITHKDMRAILPPELPETGSCTDVPGERGNVRSMINAVLDASIFLHQQMVVRRRQGHFQLPFDEGYPPHRGHLSKRWDCSCEEHELARLL